MAFRSGSVRGKGVVYSRRRGHGKNSRTPRVTPSVIYEDSAEESEITPVKFEKPAITILKTTNTSATILKDKSNTVWPLLKTTPKVSEAKIPSADEEALQTQRTHRPLSYNEICDEVLKEVFLRKRSAPPSRSSKPVEELIQSDVQPASLNSVIPTMNEPRETPVSISIGETPTTHKERQSSSDTLSQYPLTRSYTSSQATRQPESAIEILDPDDGPKFSQIVEIPEIQEELSSPPPAPVSDIFKSYVYRSSPPLPVRSRHLPSLKEETNQIIHDEQRYRRKSAIKAIFDEEAPSLKSASAHDFEVQVASSEIDPPSSATLQKHRKKTSVSSGPFIQHADRPLSRRKVLHFTDDGASSVQHFLRSPSPTKNLDDFVMLRRKRQPKSDESDLPHVPPLLPPEVHKLAGKKSSIKATDPKVRRGKQKESRWVRFLDVALTCPSDESDDEILFLPAPARRTRRTNG